MDRLNPKSLLRLVIVLALVFCAALTVAHGAYALRLPGPSNNFVVLVAFGAVSFLAVDVSRRIAVFERIFGCGHALQMLRINAVSMAASVVNHHALRDLAKHAEPSNPVRPPCCSAKEESRIPVAVKRAIPQPAAADNGVFRGEAIDFCLAHVFHKQIIAKGVQGAKGNFL